MTREKTSMLSRAAYHVDAWLNTWSKLGTALDGQTRTRFERGARLDDEQLSSLYHHDDLARIVCDIFPREALRRGFGDMSPELAADFKRMRVRDKFEEAAALGRAFGGCLVVIGIEGQPSEEPWSTPGRITFLGVHDRRFVRRDHASRVTDPESPSYGKSSRYIVQSVTGGTETTVHRSRCLVFGGSPTAEREQEELDGWDFSVLQSCYTILRDYNNAHLAGGNLLQSASEGVLKMKGLIAAIAGGKRGDLETRAQLMDLTRSVARTVMLDADGGEDYTRISVSFSGIPEMIDRFSTRLSVATGIPPIVLGRHTSSGLGDAGVSELRAWYDQVEGYRGHEIEPRLEQLLRMGYAQPPVIEWPSLWQATDAETADLEVKRAQRDQAYVLAEIVTPDEVDVSDLYPARSMALRAPEGPPIARVVEDPEEPIDPDDVTTDDSRDALAREMTDAAMDRCEHGKSNRCLLCGVERARAVVRGEDGTASYAHGTWRALR